MCLSFHQDYGNILAVGLRDGNVAVYNVSLLKNEPEYSTNLTRTKLIASVMQVHHMGFYKINFINTIH
jgi:dynein intermediate chain 1, axonemal